MLTILLTAIVSVVYASFFEWTLHRFLMHKPLLGFSYPFRAHALTHHRIFQADETYHASRTEDKEKIPMAWWNGPILVTAASIPFLFAALIVSDWKIVVVYALTVGLYYGIYEYLHWCMHLPLRKRRIIERWKFFYILNGHHLLHHRYMHKNFNVVFPLADWILGTLLKRSPLKFKQARGQTVPDVQPLGA